MNALYNIYNNEHNYLSFPYMQKISNQSITMLINGLRFSDELLFNNGSHIDQSQQYVHKPLCKERHKEQ